MRGSSWTEGLESTLLSSNRDFVPPSTRNGNFGFRVVLETGTPAPESATPATAPAPAGATKNPFGWQPIPENPFPLPRPARPTTPCRVVAWRLDGKPVDEAAFRQQFFGVPADMGEIVDLSANSFLTGRFPVPIALKADGTVVCLGERYEKELPAGLPRALVVSGGSEVAAVLAEDGSVSMLLLSDSARALAETFADIPFWKDVVAVEVSSAKAVYAIRSDGSILLSGSNDQGQLEAPGNFRSKVVKVSQNGPSTFLLRMVDRKLVAHRFGPGDPWSLPQQKESSTRFFFSSNVYATNARGLVDYCNVGKEYPASFENLRGVPTDIRDVSVAQGGRANTPGIAALREGEDGWRFWGDRKELGAYDAKYCEARAAGAWKIFFGGDYVLALKPVANLKPDDWMGTAAP